MDGESDLDGIKSLWAALTPMKRAVAGLAVLGTFLTILALGRIVSAPDYALLYGGLEPAAAGDIIASLEQQGVQHQVRNDAIYVPRAQRDTLRLTLASQGLPSSTGQGYELLDSLSGFSTTAQMFDAAYWRAKEGELARTIIVSPHIKAARVHIASATGRAFQSSTVASAAVTVSTSAGTLSTAQVRALQFLVASAVPALLPANVTVIDDRAGILSEDDTDGRSTAASTKAVTLRERAERLLMARVGPGNAVVEVSVETVDALETINERLFEPDSRVAISTEVTESSNASSGQRQAVTVASNLPDGDAATPSESKEESSETRTRTNYEISQTERQIVRQPGAIERLTVAVLVNDLPEVSATGELTYQPRDPQEIASLSELVGAAVGIDPSRGDVLTIRSMPFEPLVPLGTSASVGENAAPFDLTRLIQTAVLASVALILGLFVIRPLFAAKAATTQATPPDPQAQTLEMARSAAMLAAPTPEEPEDPVERMRKAIAAREEDSIQLLQDWIEGKAVGVDA